MIGNTGILKSSLSDPAMQEFMTGKTTPEAMNPEAAANAVLNSVAADGANAAANSGSSSGPAVVKSFSEEARSRSGNMMSGNFVGTHEDSRYLEATKKGLAIGNRTEIINDFNLMNFLSAEMKAEMGKYDSDQSQRATMMQEAMQAAEQSLNEFKAAMAEQTAEATASEADGKTESGEKTVEIATGAAGSAAANPQVAAAAATAYAPAAQPGAPAAEAAAATTAPAPSTTGGASSGQGVAKVSVDVSV